MLHKCANAACSTLFRSMHRGKLFQVEQEIAKVSTTYSRLARQNSVRKRVEHYWLCDQCFPLFTLSFEPQQGVIAVPLTTGLPHHAPLTHIPAAAGVDQLDPFTAKRPMQSVRIGLLPSPTVKPVKPLVGAGVL
jgi:hypothetical protein